MGCIIMSSGGGFFFFFFGKILKTIKMKNKIMMLFLRISIARS
jgi:hypothetical protein